MSPRWPRRRQRKERHLPGAAPTPPEDGAHEISISRVDPAARGATVGAATDAHGGREERIERGLEAFNRSPQAGMVAGLTKTLGRPRAAVGAGTMPGEIRVTVAWELTWYQWCLDPDRPGEGPREVASGTELSQLDGSARHWNATVDRHGRVSMRSAAAHGAERR